MHNETESQLTRAYNTSILLVKAAHEHLELGVHIGLTLFITFVEQFSHLFSFLLSLERLVFMFLLGMKSCLSFLLLKLKPLFSSIKGSVLFLGVDLIRKEEWLIDAFSGNYPQNGNF